MHRFSQYPVMRTKLSSQNTHSIAVIGHLAIDTIIHPNFEIENSPGGSAAAIATAAVQMGVSTSIYSKVGKDFPKEWLRVLESLGVDILNLEFAEKKDSLHVKFKYDKDQGIKHIECNDRVSDGLSVKALPRTECVHICPSQPKNQLELLQSLKGTSAMLSLHFSEYFKADYRKKGFLDMMDWTDVDMVFANETEAKAITKARSPEKMALKFHDRGVGMVAITLGEKGSLVYDGTDMHRINARDVKVIDITGCKDSYIGGFLGDYIASKDARKAARMGTYLASLTAQKKGSWAGLMSDVGVRF